MAYLSESLEPKENPTSHFAYPVLLYTVSNGELSFSAILKDPQQRFRPF